MYRNLRRRPKKIELEKKVKNKIISSSPSFVSSLYSLISPNLQIGLEKKITDLGRSQRGAPVLKIEKIDYKSKK